MSVAAGSGATVRTPGDFGAAMLSALHYRGRVSVSGSLRRIQAGWLQVYGYR